jgi:hypothetical protein
MDRKALEYTRQHYNQHAKDTRSSKDVSLDCLVLANLRTCIVHSPEEDRGGLNLHRRDGTDRLALPLL